MKQHGWVTAELLELMPCGGRKDRGGSPHSRGPSAKGSGDAALRKKSLLPSGLHHGLHPKVSHRQGSPWAARSAGTPRIKSKDRKTSYIFPREINENSSKRLKRKGCRRAGRCGAAVWGEGCAEGRPGPGRGGAAARRERCGRSGTRRDPAGSSGGTQRDTAAGHRGGIHLREAPLRPAPPRSESAAEGRRPPWGEGGEALPGPAEAAGEMGPAPAPPPAWAAPGAAAAGSR